MPAEWIDSCFKKGMSQMSKVSVIVPIYNVEKYLDKCVKSLLGQTLEDIEIILVDDGSTDNSGNIAKLFKEQNPNKVKYYRKENGGLSDARNFGMQYAQGDYIAFLDSDDYIDKNAYQEMYEKAIEENSDYVECDFIWEYPNKKRVDKREYYFGKQEMLTNVRVVAWNKLIKRDIIVNNKLEFPKGLRYEDVEFTYKLIPYLNRTSYVEKPFVHYIQRENSIANDQNKRNIEIFHVLDNVISYYKDHRLYDEYQDELEYIYTRYSFCSSLKRICKIPDVAIRDELIKYTWDNLNDKFPNWKSNKVLKNNQTFKDLYMMSINSVTYKIYTYILKSL